MPEYCKGQPSDTQVARRIGFALRSQLTSLCVQIVKNITTSTRMIDGLPAVAINATLEYVRKNHRNDRPPRDGLG